MNTVTTTRTPALPGANLADAIVRRSLGGLEHIAAALMAAIIALLLAGVLSRYVLSMPLIWVDDLVSLCFLWLAMIGSTLAMQRNEHLRLTAVLERLPQASRSYVNAFAIMATIAFLAALIEPSITYTRDEWIVRTTGLDISKGWRTAAIPFGIVTMLLVVLAYAWRSTGGRELLSAALVVGSLAAACWGFADELANLGNWNLVIFLVMFVGILLAAGVPIAFCFGLGALSYLAFTTSVPIGIVLNRMDEGMSSFILVSVPVFVLLGCVLDATGMGKAIVDFLASLLGHIKAGMSYVLLGSLFIVSGISGSKVSDMATVAPALFPEMKRRGHKPAGMIALLATGAAMADTVPPSIVLIVVGSIAGVSIAGLFQSGFIVAMVLLLALLLLARWKARNEDMSGVKRASPAVVWKVLLIAAPALVLPFLIRSAVVGGIATATEVSTIAVLYALVIGQALYGGIGVRKLYAMLVDTAALSGAILLILGTAAAMAWSIAQSGMVVQLTSFLTSLPGGWISFMAVTVLVFLVLGCILEGLPAVLLLAPIMFPIAAKLGINDVHYAMVVVVAMNIGLMMPPIGVGFYVACRIGDAKPDDVMFAIWPYLGALFVGLIAIALIPWISTVAL
ncbi:MAG TPA: TRAP transporter large permease subunit [Burkholderiaceae bacterium]|nr:TRAP transporter large permease subunit [Burkholderiaceae bacterium]